MRCHVHGGEDVGSELLVPHHKNPTGYGGPDVPENIVYLCATCHTILHKMEAALFAKNVGKASDLATQYLPNDPRRREILTKLAHRAADAKRRYHEKSDEVPEDPDEVEERTVMVTLDMPETLHGRIKTIAMGHKHSKTGREVGLARYILQVLEEHVVKDQQVSLGVPKVPTTWEIL